MRQKKVRKKAKNDEKKMLLLLPRDILAYILSMLVYDYWTRAYCCVYVRFDENIDYMTRHFVYRYAGSAMGTFVKNLSLVHPSIREILKKASRFHENNWGFHKQFFHTLRESESPPNK